MKELYIKYIAQLLGVQAWQVENCAQLFADGCTVPFISRYRKERTGGLNDIDVAEIKHWTEVFEEMEKRKASILKTIEEQQKLTPALQKQIEDCTSSAALEDLYLPYRPKRKTRATVAVARGLQPLADLLWAGKTTRPEQEASKYVKGEVGSVEEALQGARDILAERISETKPPPKTPRPPSTATTSASASPSAKFPHTTCWPCSARRKKASSKWTLTPTEKSAATNSTTTTARRRDILPVRPACK